MDAEIADGTFVSFIPHVSYGIMTIRRFACPQKGGGCYQRGDLYRRRFRGPILVLIPGRTDRPARIYLASQGRPRGKEADEAFA